jgi:2-dehydropantoate 2-reductase
LKICVYGMGAIGGTFAYGLAFSGHELSCVARGAALAALRERGLRFVDGDGVARSAAPRAVEDPAELGVQDLVLLAVKAPALPEAVSRIAPLLGPGTIVLPAMNGVPWWFFQGFGGELEGSSLASVDPAGAIAAAIPAGAVVGCVLHFGASCPEPGLVKAQRTRRLILGEPSGERTKRLEGLAAVLGGAGFAVELSTSIQKEIWYKLWGNMTMNPLSAITGATMDRILDDPLVARFCLDIMAEAKRIGAKIGCPIEEGGEERLEISRHLGAFKTSMLQDVEAGRPVELDALVSSVREIGALVGEPTPSIDALLGLARLHARTRGLYPEGAP